MNKLIQYINFIVRYTNLYGLLCILLFIQIPDQFWMSLHQHKHHHCGLYNVIHEYNGDCIHDQKFLLHWLTNTFKNYSIYLIKLTSIYLLTDYQIFVDSITHDINRNKAPPFIIVIPSKNIPYQPYLNFY